MRRLAFALLLASSSMAGCLTPDFPAIPSNPDANPPPPVDAMLDCELRVYPVGDGHHNAGQDCLTCHNGQAQGANVFTFAGTVFKDTAGTIPKTGATVIVIDSAGTVSKAVTQANGNFYSSDPLVAPYSVGISECPPPSIPMVENFSDGSCNSCHSGAQAPGRVIFSQ
jgi:hypothetical protein